MKVKLNHSSITCNTSKLVLSVEFPCTPCASVVSLQPKDIYIRLCGSPVDGGLVFICIGPPNEVA